MKPNQKMVMLAAGLSLAVGMTGAPVARADDPETDEPVVKTLRDTAAHAMPDASAADVFSLPANKHAVWIDKQKDNGFFRVIRMDKGPQGWVPADDVEIVKDQTHAHSESSKACVADLNGCPTYGCAEEKSPEGVANELKRTPPNGPLRATLSVGDFGSLQRKADALFRQGPPDLNERQRKQLANISLGDKSVSEGDRVRTIGYIAKGGDGLHVNAVGESVNCMLKQPTDNDFHIPIVEHPGDSKYQGIVVEMIPQDRPSRWNIDALKQIQAQGNRLWIEGGLHYDSIHYVSADPQHPIKDEPSRVSLWEIHPVTKFLVCRKEHCDPEREKDWSALADLNLSANEN
jgi:hypothetical protein